MVVIVLVVSTLVGAAVTFYRCFLGGTFAFLFRCGKRSDAVEGGDGDDDDDGDGKGFENPLSPGGSGPANGDATDADDFPPCVATLPALPILSPGDPQHVNTSTNRPYTVNGTVPWTGRPPVLRGPQPSCVVPTFTEDGREIPREERVQPGPGLFETPPATSAMPRPPKLLTRKQRFQNKWRARFGMKPFEDVVYPAPAPWYKNLSYARWLPFSPVMSEDGDGSDGGSGGSDSDGSDSDGDGGRDSVNGFTKEEPLDWRGSLAEEREGGTAVPRQLPHAQLPPPQSQGGYAVVPHDGYADVESRAAFCVPPSDSPPPAHQQPGMAPSVLVSVQVPQESPHRRAMFLPQSSSLSHEHQSPTRGYPQIHVSPISVAPQQPVMRQLSSHSNAVGSYDSGHGYDTAEREQRAPLCEAESPEEVYGYNYDYGNY